MQFSGSSDSTSICAIKGACAVKETYVIKGTYHFK